MGIYLLLFFSLCSIQNQRILELEAQLEDLRESTAGSASSGEVADLQRKLASLTTETMSQQAEIKRRVSKEEELETRIASQAQQVAAVQESLGKKDEEMRVMEERYKRYLENRLRNKYGFEGTPLRLQFRKKRKPGEPRG